MKKRDPQLDAITEPGQLLYLDSCMVNPPTPEGHQHFLKIVDAYSRYHWSLFLKRKSDAAKAFDAWAEKFKVFNPIQGIQALRSDNAPDLIKGLFRDTRYKHKIKEHQTVSAGRSTANAAESAIRVSQIVLRSIMRPMGCPMKYWHLGIAHADWIRNRLPTRGTGRIPYCVLHNKKTVDISYFRVFYSPAFVKIQVKRSHKAADRSALGRFIGCKPDSRTPIILLPTGKTMARDDVMFIENPKLASEVISQYNNMERLREQNISRVPLTKALDPPAVRHFTTDIAAALPDPQPIHDSQEFEPIIIPERGEQTGPNSPTM
jgi:hypothetical protein